MGTRFGVNRQRGERPQRIDVHAGGDSPVQVGNNAGGNVTPLGHGHRLLYQVPIGRESNQQLVNKVRANDVSQFVDRSEHIFGRELPGIAVDRTGNARPAAAEEAFYEVAEVLIDGQVIPQIFGGAAVTHDQRVPRAPASNSRNVPAGVDVPNQQNPRRYQCGERQFLARSFGRPRQVEIRRQHEPCCTNRLQDCPSLLHYGLDFAGAVQSLNMAEENDQKRKQ